jgi:hypothetical protein
MNAGTPKAIGRTLPGLRFSFGATSKNTLELAIGGDAKSPSLLKSTSIV